MLVRNLDHGARNHYLFTGKVCGGRGLGSLFAVEVRQGAGKVGGVVVWLGAGNRRAPRRRRLIAVGRG